MRHVSSPLKSLGSNLSILQDEIGADASRCERLEELASEAAFEDANDSGRSRSDAYFVAEPIRLAINVPGAFLTRLPLVKLLREQAPASRQWPGLTLEVTEEDALRDIDAAREISTQLKIYGVRLSIDDFGMGYSSLARLREIPFSEIKLDRSLVDGCADDVVQGALCRSVIDLAHSFGASAVAEGVERESDLVLLRSIRCDIAQGYFFARPMPKAELIDRLGCAAHADTPSLATA